MHRCFLALLAALSACTPTPRLKLPERPHLDLDEPWSDPELDYPTPHRAAAEAKPPPPPTPLVVRNAVIMTGAGQRLDRGTMILEGGKITYVGAEDRPAPAGARVIDAAGRYLTPGLIDTHSHIGVYAAPNVPANSDGNEASLPMTPEARADYGYWPQDPAITRAIAGGVTTALILPGSSNMIGGRGFTVHMRPGRSADEVRFSQAPATLKMACGENPKRTHGERGGPKTRMGAYAAFHTVFQQAAEYRARWTAYGRERALWLKRRDLALEMNRELAARGVSDRIPRQPAPDPPPRDAKLDTLAEVLNGNILVQVHCYKASDIQQMVAIAGEFGFQIRSFHHALDAYKVRDLLAANHIAISTWAGWWGFKMEAFDGIPENAALFTESGGRAVIHSDNELLIQRLNQEAAKAYQAGLAAGVKLSEDDALRWITANPAWVLGIDQITGSLEAGKRADAVLWSEHPFSVYARPDVVIGGGEVLHDRTRGLQPTDFELGNSALDEEVRR